MVTESLVEVPFSVHGLIFIESVRGPLHLDEKYASHSQTEQVERKKQTNKQTKRESLFYKLH